MNFASDARRALSAALLLALPVQAWNGVGHRAVAGAAYDRLTPAARGRVDDMMRRFPDYDLLVATSQAPSNAKERARAVFMTAAYWPDMIKGDPRFYDESRRDAVAMPARPGFPDMKRRQNWHYINVGFSTDGTSVREAPAPNVLTQLKLILDRIGRPPSAARQPEADDDPVYLLPWLLHLTGDIHQPLHCATRFRQGQNDPQGRPWGDLGGNTVLIEGGANLHALWDDALGITPSPKYVNELVKTLLRGAPREIGPLTPEAWVQEGFEVAKKDVYSFGNDGGTKERPLRPDVKYMIRMREVARERAALGGARLAAVLNARLR